MTRLEQLRFQRLTRHFVHNFFDNDLLAPAGEASKVFVTAFALLGALGFTLSLLLVGRYTFGMIGSTPEFRAWAEASDNLLMVLMAMAIMGVMVALAWDGLLPSRRDGQILGALPVSVGEIYRARLLATVLLFALVLAAFAVLPGLALAGGQSRQDDWVGLFRRLAGCGAAMVTASGFVFFGATALQSLLQAALPQARFLQVSAIVQPALLVASFAMLFMTPGLAAAQRQGWDWVVYLPPYWFFALWQKLGQGRWPYGDGAAWSAVVAFAAAVASSVTLSAALHGRAIRKAVEGMPLAPKGPGWARRAFEEALNTLLLREPRERAVFWFAARTVARQRSHRLLLAIYMGLGISWVLAGLSAMLTSDLASGVIRPNAALCTIPVDLAAMLLIGMRVMFGMPVEVKANWIARISTSGSGEFATGAARKLMLVMGIVPMALIPLPLMAAAWGWKAAAVHLWFYSLETALLLELLMGRFNKFPFGCSWLPGQGNLKVKLGMYFILFGAMSSFLGSLEAHVLVKGSTTTLVNSTLVMGIWLGWLVWRRRGAERPVLAFEERSALDLNALQLQ